MGRHEGMGRGAELPLHTVTLDSFFMDVYETTTKVEFLRDDPGRGALG